MLELSFHNDKENNASSNNPINVNNEPKNSRSPKFKSNGNNKPANKKIENKTVNKSFNTKAPVNSPLINSGPIPKSANKLNIPPNTLEILFCFYLLFYG